MHGESFLRAVCIFAAGFAAAVVVGARNGEQMAAGVADVLDTCDELARVDRAGCLARVEVMASAVHEFGEKCVLLPGSERLRVARVPRGVMP